MSDLHAPTRWVLVRDVVAFQLKLLLDGMRDAVLVPVSLVVALLDLVGLGPRAGRQFYLLLHLGRRTESWINLFGAADRPRETVPQPPAGMDALIARLERAAVEEYARGNVSASARDAVERALEALNRRPPP